MMNQQVVLQDAAAGQWLYFSNPWRVITTRYPDEVLPCLDLIEFLVDQQGWHAAGFIGYEAAPAFDPALPAAVAGPAGELPLLWFGLYPAPTVSPGLPDLPRGGYRLGDWTPSVSREQYEEAIARIKAHISRGETYQVNYTFRLRAPFSGDPWTLFEELYRAQLCRYAAYVDTGRFTICSASPELFFRLDDRELMARPMKGTAARGRTLAEDETQARWLFHSEKNRAENVMIVDMIRNDMGRVAQVGSVSVPRLFEVERYPTLWQMTSTTTAQTDASLADIMSALFPCASITGAPKHRTMQIIAALETTPRQVYTGCIGFIAPRRQAQFNVAIRTVLVDKPGDSAEYGVGGGIVWDSTGRDEYAECQLKARVLTERRPQFSLLETMVWTPGEGYFLLDYHLRRLAGSAVYFSIPLDLDRVRVELDRLAASFSPLAQRVRLLVGREGTITTQAALLDRPGEAGPVYLRLAAEGVDSANPFLYHKTTHRQIYEAARAARPDAGDVLLWNERGEVTETTIANVVVRWQGRLVTPPVLCGLLPGTFRAWLLEQGEIQEKVISVTMLKQAEKIYVINSVRKWREAVVMW